MPFLKKRKETYQVTTTKEREVTDWGATLYFWGQIVAAILISGGIYFVTKTEIAFLIIPAFFLAAVVDSVLIRYGKWFRVIKWVVIIAGILYLLPLLAQ